MKDKINKKDIVNLNETQLDEAQGGVIDRSYSAPNFNLSLNSNQSGVISKIDPDALRNAKK